MGREKMKIRPAAKKDFEEMYLIIREEYGKPPYNEKWTRQNGLKTLNYYSKWGKIYVADICNEVAGLLVIHPEFYNTGLQIDLKELAVKSKFQGKGVGRALIQKAEEFARKKKAKLIYLMTSSDAPAFNFYKKLGYKVGRKTVIFGKEL